MRKSIPNKDLLLLPVILLISLFYFSGIKSIPFHPDESTNLFMSSDIEMFFDDPTQVFWNSDRVDDLRQIYRLRDAPLSRYVIGIGRILTDKSALPVDWDWSKTWSENQAAGAFPSADLLVVGRLSVSIIFPISLLLAYQIGKNIRGHLTGWLAVGLLASNSLVLLHTRRVMAESLLLFTSISFLYWITRDKKIPLITGALAGLAFCAKQSNLPLFIIGLVDLFWHSNDIKESHIHLIKQFCVYILTFILVIFGLNPFLWKNPMKAVEASIQSRQTLINDQVTALNAINPNAVSISFMDKITGLIAQVFITPPMPADVGNYLDETIINDQAYQAKPINRLFRGTFGGGISLLLVLTGFSFSMLGYIKKLKCYHDPIKLLLLGAIIEFAFLLIFIPIPWQRYYLPLIPFIIIFMAIALEKVLFPIINLVFAGITAKTKFPDTY